MTNDPINPRPHISSARLREHLAQLGVIDIHGLEILRLIRLNDNAYETVTSERMKDDQMSEPRWRLLLRLLIEEQHGNHAVNPTHLSQTQQVSKNTISALLRSLEEQGLIERTLDADDLRQFRIRLTEAGRAFVRASMPHHVAFLNQLLGDFSTEEVATLQTLLDKLHSSLLTHCKQQQEGTLCKTKSV